MSLKMATSQIIKQRLEHVYEYALCGMSIPTIAEHIGVSTRQVDRYLNSIRAKYAKREQREDSWTRIADYSESARLRKKELWQLVENSASKPEHILTALALLRKEDDHAMRIDLITGVLPREVGLPRIIIEDRATKKQRIDIRKQLMMLAEEEEKVKQEMEKKKKCP